MNGWRISPGRKWRALRTFDHSGWFAVNLAADVMIHASSFAELTDKVRNRRTSDIVACPRCGREVQARKRGGQTRHKRWDTRAFCR